MKGLIVLLSLLSSLAFAFTSPLIEKFKKEGSVPMRGPCIYKQELYMCMVVEIKGKQWIVIGEPGDDHFHEKYILEITGPHSTKEVWGYTWLEV